MFGVIVSGRLVQTDFQRVGETQFLITIPDADNINHLVVFLVGVQPFPMGTGGLVYFSWPDPVSPPTWQLLGHISNDKPSAIYRIHSLKKHDNKLLLPFGQQQISHNAQIGISMEPLSSVQTQALHADGCQKEEDESFLQYTRKMLESFVNYVTSFALTQANMTPNPTETYVPLSAVQSWYVNFERRLQLSPYFWRS